MNDSWNSALEDTVIRPIARKAIDLYGKKVLEQHRIQLEVEIDGYKVNMIRNMILNENIYKMIWPESADAKYMVNVEVGVPSGDTVRWFVGIFFMFKDDIWVDDNSLNKELTTYTMKGK